MGRDCCTLYTIEAKHRTIAGHWWKWFIRHAFDDRAAKSIYSSSLQSRSLWQWYRWVLISTTSESFQSLKRLWRRFHGSREAKGWSFLGDFLKSHSSLFLEFLSSPLPPNSFHLHFLGNSLKWSFSSSTTFTRPPFAWRKYPTGKTTVRLSSAAGK